MNRQQMVEAAERIRGARLAIVPNGRPWDETLYRMHRAFLYATSALIKLQPEIYGSAEHRRLINPAESDPDLTRYGIPSREVMK